MELQKLLLADNLSNGYQTIEVSAFMRILILCFHSLVFVFVSTCASSGDRSQFRITGSCRKDSGFVIVKYKTSEDGYKTSTKLLSHFTTRMRLIIYDINVLEQRYYRRISINGKAISGYSQLCQVLKNIDKPDEPVFLLDPCCQPKLQWPRDYVC